MSDICTYHVKEVEGGGEKAEVAVPGKDGHVVAGSPLVGLSHEVHQHAAPLEEPEFNQRIKA